MGELKEPESGYYHTVLYVVIGSVNTRVCLFDRMDDKYSFIGAASARLPEI
jgi:hypothetical protein